MTEMPDAVWLQIGEMLRHCREDMDPRYAGRGGLTLFAEERGINRRVAWDIENAKRDNYTRAMLRDIESAYGLRRRTIDGFLAAAGKDVPPDDDDEFWDSATPEQRRIGRLFIEALERSAEERERRGQESA